MAIIKGLSKPTTSGIWIIGVTKFSKGRRSQSHEQNIYTYSKEYYTEMPDVKILRRTASRISGRMAAKVFHKHTHEYCLLHPVVLPSAYLAPDYRPSFARESLFGSREPAAMCIHQVIIKVLLSE